ITQFSKTGKGPGHFIQNIFAGYLKRRFREMDFNLLWEPYLYNMLRRIHGLCAGNPYQAPETRILSRERHEP
ncbi:MAG: hypothetical protein PHV60_10200, partial [bacterium]|nr:hypothetical protein [bacterium]